MFSTENIDQLSLAWLELATKLNIFFANKQTKQRVWNSLNTLLEKIKI